MMALDSVEIDILNCITKDLCLIFPFGFKITQNPEFPLYAFEPKRNQYYANKILSRLHDEIPRDGEKLISITSVDLCTPLFSFIFGMAQLSGRVAIASYHRLRQGFYHLPEDDELMLERLTKECIHELGHCFGLVHCDSLHCAMFFAHGVQNIDIKDKAFCRACKEYFEQTMEKENHAKK